MVIVRLLLVLSLAAIGVSLALYLIKRDRRYLRFVAQVLKFTLILLAAVLLFYAAERLLAPGAARSLGRVPNLGFLEQSGQRGLERTGRKPPLQRDERTPSSAIPLTRLAFVQ